MSDRNRERRYRDIIESAVDFAIIATDTDGVITDWNTGAEKVLGWSADCIKVLDLDGNLAFMNEGGLKVMEVSDFNAIRGCPWLQFWEREGNIHAVAALESARAGKPARFRGQAATMKGTPKSWDVQATPILGKDGTTARILSVSRDVTETEQIDAAARRLVTLVEQSADFIGEAALDGSVSQINPAGMAMVGLFDPAAVKATRIAEYFTPAARKAFESVVVPAIRSAGSWEGDLAFRHFQTGEAIPIFANIFPLRDASGAITSYGAVARDQRERQRADRFRYALADIGDHLREVDDLIAMQVSVCARIGEALGADRVGFGARRRR